MGNLKEFSGYAGWWLGSKIDRDRPLVTTMMIHLNCNLRCRHCDIARQLDAGTLPPKNSLTYDEICEDLRTRYKQGARIAYFEGGEPTMWSDGERRLEDLITFAKSLGYLNTGYTTNGTGRICTASDTISVSLDGPRDVHDAIRQEGVFDTLMNNLASLEFDGSVFANMVVQKTNIDHIRETAEIVRQNPRMDGIVFNFITPPPADQALSPDERRRAVEEISALKDEGFPILNSRKGLRDLLVEDWTDSCPIDLTVFTLPDGSHAKGCPMRSNPESCRHCGFAAAREYRLVKRGDPRTILELAPTFALSGKKRGQRTV